jgi:hypothetical protein
MLTITAPKSARTNIFYASLDRSFGRTSLQGGTSRDDECVLAMKCRHKLLDTVENLNFRATLFVFLLPLLVLRIALMVGNWGQHAIVDEHDPDSDFRSSITLIDVAVSFPLLSIIEDLTH